MAEIVFVSLYTISAIEKYAGYVNVISYKRDSMAGCVLRVRKDGIKPEALLSSGIFPGAKQFEDGFNFTSQRVRSLMSS